DEAASTSTSTSYSSASWCGTRASTASMLFSALYATMRMSSRGLVVMRPWDGSSCWWRGDRRRAHCRAPHEQHEKGDLRRIIVCEPDEVKRARRHDVMQGTKEYVEASAVTRANNT